MFTTPCFIKKNSKGLREKLNSLGYKLNHGKAWGKYLCVFKTEDTKEFFYVASPYWDLKTMPDFENSIDCGTNEELFLAIAALRDDNDYMQWFITEADQPWVDCPIGSFILCTTEYRYPKEWIGNADFSSLIVPAHKATVEELIEHFKNKEN